MKNVSRATVARLVVAMSVVAMLGVWLVPAASATDLGEFNYVGVTDGRVVPGTVGEIIVATSIQGGTANNVTLPIASTQPSGRRYIITNAAATGVLGVVAGNATDTINGNAGSWSLTLAAVSGTTVKTTAFVTDGVSAWYTVD